MFADVILFATYFAIMMAGIWLFLNRDSYRGWFYLIYAFVFACLLIGLHPDLHVMKLVGYILLLSNAGLQVLTNFLIDLLAKNEMDIQQGIDRKFTRVMPDV